MYFAALDEPTSKAKLATCESVNYKNVITTTSRQSGRENMKTSEPEITFGRQISNCFWDKVIKKTNFCDS